MKIAVTAKGGSLSAQVDQRFGRCAYFVVVDSETMKFNAFSNPASEASGGAGPAAAREISKRKAQVVLTGEVGHKAKQALETAEIEIVTNATGTVKEAVDAYLKKQN
jgi:predicted Fe-Mo cluster-binding NifX family protein